MKNTAPQDLLRLWARKNTAIISKLTILLTNGIRNLELTLYDQALLKKTLNSDSDDYRAPELSTYMSDKEIAASRILLKRNKEVLAILQKLLKNPGQGTYQDYTTLKRAGLFQKARHSSVLKHTSNKISPESPPRPMGQPLSAN